MEPVEINAGLYYLRALRADRLLDDRPALVAAFTDPVTRHWVPEYDVSTLAAATDYVARRTAEWESGERCSWGVAEPTTGELLAEVGLKSINLDVGTADVACWTHPAHRGKGVVVHALGPVLRFGFSALNLRQVGYQHAEGNEASRRVAEKCGFTLDRRIPGGTLIDGQPRDLLVWIRTNGDTTC